MNIAVFIILFIICGIALLWMKQILQNNSYPVNGLNSINDFDNFWDLISNTGTRKKKNFYSVILLLSISGPFVIIFAFLMGINTPGEDSCKFYNKFLSYNIRGVVVNKFINTSNHALETLTLNYKGRNISGPDIGRFSPETYKYVQIGDTIIKEPGSSFILVKNNKRTKRFKSYKMGCNDTGSSNTALTQKPEY